MLTPLPVVVIDADVELAWMAGRLREATAQAGLSLETASASLSQ